MTIDRQIPEPQTHTNDLHDPINQERGTAQNEGILLVDKEVGITSFQVVRRIKRAFKQKKVGHGGTLDPFASGLLISFLGKKYTRMASSLLSSSKSYQARFMLGVSTDSYDLTGEVIERCTDRVSREHLVDVLSLFQGVTWQVPPMFSARRVGGKRLYELARRGVEVERSATPVALVIELVSYDYPYVELVIHCSKGTYIRSIAHDLGQKLGVGAHVDQLRRIRVGPYTLEGAIASTRLKLSSGPALISSNKNSSEKCRGEFGSASHLESSSFQSEAIPLGDLDQMLIKTHDPALNPLLEDPIAPFKDALHAAWSEG